MWFSQFAQCLLLARWKKMVEKVALFAEAGVSIVQQKCNKFQHCHIVSNAVMFLKRVAFISFPTLSLQDATQRGPAGRVIEPQAGKTSTKTTVSVFRLHSSLSLYVSLEFRVIIKTLASDLTVEQSKWSYIFVKKGRNRHSQLVRAKWDGMSF